MLRVTCAVRVKKGFYIGDKMIRPGDWLIARLEEVAGRYLFRIKNVLVNIDKFDRLEFMGGEIHLEAEDFVEMLRLLSGKLSMHREDYAQMKRLKPDQKICEGIRQQICVALEVASKAAQNG